MQNGEAECFAGRRRKEHPVHKPSHHKPLKNIKEQLVNSGLPAQMAGITMFACACVSEYV